MDTELFKRCTSCKSLGERPCTCVSVNVVPADVEVVAPGTLDDLVDALYDAETMLASISHVFSKEPLKLNCESINKVLAKIRELWVKLDCFSHLTVPRQSLYKKLKQRSEDIKAGRVTDTMSDW